MDSAIEKILRIFEWARKKVDIHHSTSVTYFKEREIWWVNIGENIGHEENGKNKHFDRPALIFKRINQDLIWVIPITSSIRHGRWLYSFQSVDGPNCMLLDQMRAISTRRLLRKLETIDESTYFEIVRLIIRNIKK